MINKELFHSLGLTGNEAKVYVSLLELGNAHVSEITEVAGFTEEMFTIPYRA